jgi:hypothetical protein
MSELAYPPGGRPATRVPPEAPAHPRGGSVHGVLQVRTGPRPRRPGRPARGRLRGAPLPPGPRHRGAVRRALLEAGRPVARERNGLREDRPVLAQNTGRQAAVVRLVREARSEFGDRLDRLRARDGEWEALAASVDQTIRKMPLFKLQKVGREPADEFLYPHRLKGRGADATIELDPGSPTASGPSTPWSSTWFGARGSASSGS